MSCFILVISLRISRNISCLMASNSAFEAAVVLEEEVAAMLLMAFSAIPFSFVTSISSAVEPNRLRPGLGDSEPLEDFPVGEDPFSKFLRSPESSCENQNSAHYNPNSFCPLLANSALFYRIRLGSKIRIYF